MDAKISPSFWNDDSLASPSLRLAALWLRTNAYISPIGFGEYSLRRFSFETGLPSEALAECFAALGSRCVHDERAYWLRDFIAENFGRGEALSRNNFARGFQRQITAARCDWLLTCVRSEYPELFQQATAHSEPLPRGSSSGPTTREEKRGEEKRGEERIRGAGGKEREPALERKPADLAAATAYAAEIGLPPAQAEAFFDHFEANGWRQGGRTPLRSWRAAMRNWQRRGAQFSKNLDEVSARGGVPLFDPVQPPPGYIDALAPEPASAP